MRLNYTGNEIRNIIKLATQLAIDATTDTPGITGGYM
jgi:hypothetical protein